MTLVPETEKESKERWYQHVILFLHMSNGQVLRTPLGNKKPLVERWAAGKIEEFVGKLRNSPHGGAWMKIDGRPTFIAVNNIAYVTFEEGPADP